MNMNKKILNWKRIAALTMAMALLGAWTIAFGQLDPGEFHIYQNGSIVGQIHVPVRTAGQALYSEHWVLYSNYVYPNARNNVKTEIVADPTKSYANETEFFRSVPWGPGFRYEHAISADTTTLPGR